MNKTFKKQLRHLAFVFVGSLALASCVKDEPKNKPQPNPEPQPVAPVTPAPVQPAQPVEVETPVVDMEVQPTGQMPGINTTEVRKIVLSMYEGHIHEPSSFHYVSGPEGFKNKSLKYEQDMTLEYRAGVWTVTSGEKFFVFNKGNAYGSVKIPAPVYGLWVNYYDASGDLINSQFAAKGKYQAFFRPKSLKSFVDGSASEHKPSDVVGYMYKDTNPWSTSSRDGAHVVGETDPVGLKGFFYFNKENVRFALNLELWETPEGKLTEGKSAPFYEPSAHIKKTGKPVLSVSIPCYVWLDRETLDEVDEDTTLESFTKPGDKQVLLNLAKLLGLENIDTILEDINLRIDGQRSGDEGGRWF